jgi:hypothetical protein
MKILEKIMSEEEIMGGERHSAEGSVTVNGNRPQRGRNDRKRFCGGCEYRYPYPSFKHSALKLLLLA